MSSTLYIFNVYKVLAGAAQLSSMVELVEEFAGLMMLKWRIINPYVGLCQEQALRHLAIYTRKVQ